MFLHISRSFILRNNSHILTGNVYHKLLIFHTYAISHTEPERMQQCMLIISPATLIIFTINVIFSILLKQKGQLCAPRRKAAQTVGMKASLPFCTVVLHKIRQQKGQLISKR